MKKVWMVALTLSLAACGGNGGDASMEEQAPAEETAPAVQSAPEMQAPADSAMLDTMTTKGPAATSPDSAPQQ